MARNVEIFRIAAKGTVEEVRKTLIATAKREHARIMTTDPKPERFTRSVDGVVGAAEEKVKSGGVIRYHYQRLEQIIQFAMETLFDLSPVLSGEYRKSHMLFVNGVAAASLKDWDGSGEVVITNPLPYARKIEIGKMTMRVPGSDRVYQQAAQVVKRRYGNQVTVTFTFRAILGGYSVNQASAASTGKSWWLGHSGEARTASGTLESMLGRKFGKTAHNKSGARFPALVIAERI
jgi:hypothetical protein